MRNFFNCCLYLFSFICVGILMEKGHYIGGAFLLCIIISVLLFIIEQGVINELTWINKCILDKNELKNIKEQSQYYSSMRSYLKNGMIKKGISIEEIYKFLEREGDFSYRPYLSFDQDKKESDVELRGFGLNIPVPKLILKIKDGKLTDWKEKSSIFI